MKWQKQPPGLFNEKSVLRVFTKGLWKLGLRPATLLKKRLWHRCFPVNFVKFLRTPFLQNISEGLLLKWNKKHISSFLRRFDTIKTFVDEIYLNFPELLIAGKHAKIRFKNWRSPYYFLSSRGQKIKNITKTEHTRLFLFTFMVSFLMAFLAQKLIYTVNMWFNFVSDSFF